jgi:hypothetical protein
MMVTSWKSVPKRNRHLPDLGIKTAREGIHFLQQRHLLGKTQHVGRIEVAIELAVAPLRRIADRAAAAMTHNGVDRITRAGQCRRGEVGGMGIGCRLAADGAQAKALAIVAGGGFQLAIVEDKAFALALLDEEFTVIGAEQRLLREARGLGKGEIANGVE